MTPRLLKMCPGSSLAAVVLLALISIGACAPRLQPPGTDIATPHLTEDAYITADSARLSMTIWPAEEAANPKAVIVALHGFNDYRNAFREPSVAMNARGIVVLAYDQRGFGEDPNAGIWAGGDVMASDLRNFVGLTRQRYPDTPVFVLGHSMGGAVALVAYGADMDPALPLETPDGLILVAPAVWGWSTMNPFYAAGLWLGAHIMPGHGVTGSGFEIYPSDNIEMLRGQMRDPLVIKKTRIDSVYGLVNVMEEALKASRNVRLPVLLLHGQNDDIIRSKPIGKLRERLPEDHVFLTYKSGYHMLLRDLESDRPIRDIADFTLARAQSGGDQTAAR